MGLRPNVVKTPAACQGYFGDPEDMAYLIAILASPRARYITGELIYVDGGMHRFAF